jgi:hypothetical protein
MKTLRYSTATAAGRPTRMVRDAVSTRSIAGGTDLRCRLCGAHSTFRGIEERAAVGLHAKVCPHVGEGRLAQAIQGARPGPRLLHLWA